MLEGWRGNCTVTGEGQRDSGGREEGTWIQVVRGQARPFSLALSGDAPRLRGEAAASFLSLAGAARRHSS